jgi:hypothetical protein
MNSPDRCVYEFWLFLSKPGCEECFGGADEGLDLELPFECL